MIQELNDSFSIPTNEFQTPINKELLTSLPEEVAEQLLDFIDNVEFIKRLISPNRKRAKDLPRDEKGRIIIDITNPHILEDMDYFRPSAIHYQKHGCYTFLMPNPNPNSEYAKWFHEEKRRCREGYIRESDGEWVTGYMYFFLNYCPIMITKTSEGNLKADRVRDFPKCFEGIYWRSHYLYQARSEGKHAAELAKRGAGKSFFIASMLAKNFILGESETMTKDVTSIITAYAKEYLSDNDGTLSKFEPMINFIAENTEFPRLRLRSSSDKMFWRMGYIDSNGRKKGSLNSVMGVSSKDDVDKLRGKRGFIYFEEFGNFPGLLDIYNTVRSGLEDGIYAFGQAYLIGTANNKEANFDSAKTLLYEPELHRIKALENVFDKPKQGRNKFAFFFPAYINREGCYNKDGVSDVVAALIEILKYRFEAKYSANPTTVLSRIAEFPITPAEAIIKVKTAYFPITALTERLRQLDNDSRAFDDVYIGELYWNNQTNKVEFKPTDAEPIRKYGVANTTVGALEIFEMPEKDMSGNVYESRYIMGYDPVNNDMANSSSLSSVFVLDLFTDKIVAEYTGRHPFVEDNFEIVRLLCLFYNARCLYESNNKGTFAYFSKMNCTHLLADTPEYLRDKQLVKYSAFGSSQKGVNASAIINNYANTLIKEWLLKPVPTIITEEGEEKTISVSNLYFLRNRALIEELIAFTPEINVDRVRALGMLMLLREEKMILYGNSLNKESYDEVDKSDPCNDSFFSENYDDIIKNYKD